MTLDEIVAITGRSVTYSSGSAKECHWGFATLPGEPADVVVAAQLWPMDMDDAVGHFHENYAYFAQGQEPDVGEGAYWNSQDSDLALLVRDRVYTLGQDNLASTDSETRRLVVAIAKRAAEQL